MNFVAGARLLLFGGIASVLVRSQFLVFEALY